MSPFSKNLAKGKSREQFSLPRRFENKNYIIMGNTKLPVSDTYPDFKTAATVSEKAGALIDILFRPNELPQRIKTLHLLAGYIQKIETQAEAAEEYKQVAEQLKEVNLKQKQQILALTTNKPRSADYFQQRMLTDQKFRRQFLNGLPQDID